MAGFLRDLLKKVYNVRISHETILQVVELYKDESGKLHSIALSDGEYVSHNVDHRLE